MSSPLKIGLGVDLQAFARDLDAAQRRVDAASKKAVVAPRLLVPDSDMIRRTVEKGLEGVAVDKLAERLAAGVALSKPLSLAKTGIDLGANKVADVALGVDNRAFKSKLDESLAVLAGAVKAMTRVATIPLSVGHVGFKAGLAIAEGLLFAKVKQLTGASTVQMVVGYAVYKVGLTIVTRLTKAAVSATARIALIPFKVAFNVLRASLRTAFSLVKATARKMADVAAIPFRAAGSALSMASPLAAVGGLAAGAGALAGAVKAASDLEEVVSKVDVMFGSAAATIAAGADEMAKKFGIVRSDFMDGAAGLGALGKAAGLANGKAAEMGVTMAKLGADMASQFNVSFEEALEKLRSGLAGEAEPLRRYGVLLSAAAVETKALEMGLAELTKKGKINADTLSEGDKVLARQAIITESLAAAHGDLGRTAGSLANRLRELWGRVQNLAATLGAYLLPAVKEVAATFAQMTSDLASAAEGRSAVFAGWAESLRQAASWIGVVYRNFGLFRSAAGAILKNLGANLGEVFSVGFRNAVNWAKYFANVLGQAIQEAVQNALHQSLSSNRATKAFAPAKFEKRVEFLPPKTIAPDIKVDPAVAATVAAAKLMDTLRGLPGRLAEARQGVADFVGKLLPQDKKAPPAKPPAAPPIDWKDVAKKVIRQQGVGLADAVDVNSKEAYSAVMRNASGRSLEKHAAVTAKATKDTAEACKKGFEAIQRAAVNNVLGGVGGFGVGVLNAG